LISATREDSDYIVYQTCNNWLFCIFRLTLAAGYLLIEINVWFWSGEIPHSARYKYVTAALKLTNTVAQLTRLVYGFTFPHVVYFSLWLTFPTLSEYQNHPSLAVPIGLKKAKGKADEAHNSVHCCTPLAIKGPVTLGNFSCNMSRNFVALLWEKLHATLPSVTPLCNIRKICCSTVRTVAKSRTDFCFSQRLRHQKSSKTCSFQGTVYVTLGNFSCNLYWKKIARQVAKEIA